jgi:sugar-specific transcriptional regulator TrmB
MKTKEIIENMKSAINEQIIILEIQISKFETEEFGNHYLSSSFINGKLTILNKWATELDYRKNEVINLSEKLKGNHENKVS